MTEKTNLQRKHRQPGIALVARLILAVALCSAAIVAAPARAQTIVRASQVEATLDESFRSMYNLQFDEALRSIEAAKQQDKDDPLPWAAQVCAVLFREFDRLHILRSDMFASDEAFAARPAYEWVPENKVQFEEAAAGGEKIARERLARDKMDVKALFVLALITGLRGDASAMITKHNLAALSYIKTATGYSDKLLTISPDYYDAYVGTGLGKYIIGGKPAPVRWILRIGGVKGDQEQGLTELTRAAEHGRFLSPFASIVLAFDDIRHNNKAAAKKKLELLRDQFPRNPLFAAEIAKCNKPSGGSGQ
jgi:hypothetical protein